jgi:hypothetical protein
VAGQPGAIRARALDAHQLDDAEATEPPQELAVPAGGGREGLGAEEGAEVVEGGGDVDVEVGVDASGDAIGQAVHCHLLRLRLGDGTAPAGRADKTATGLCDRLLVGHVPPDRFGVGWVSEPGRRIIFRTVLVGERQPEILGSDLARSPIRTLLPIPTRVVDAGPVHPRCRILVMAALTRSERSRAEAPLPRVQEPAGWAVRT